MGETTLTYRLDVQFKQSIDQYRLRITSAFLPAELTCAYIRIEDPPGNQSVGDQRNLAFPIGIGSRRTGEVAFELEAIDDARQSCPAGASAGSSRTPAPSANRPAFRPGKPLEPDLVFRTGLGF